MKFIIWLQAVIYVWFHPGSEVITETSIVSSSWRESYITKKVITYIAVTRGSRAKGNLKLLKVFYGKRKVKFPKIEIKEPKDYV